MNQSEQINELAAALSKMQGQVGPVYKNKTAKIFSKRTNTSFSYSYADLAGIWDTIRKPLSDAGLSICQTFSDNMIVTILMHSSGQWIKSLLPINGMSLPPQELGSEITYMRRYGLTSILGISADDDDDGATAGVDVSKFKEAPTKINHIAPPVASTILPMQAKELASLLSECTADYQKNFWTFLKREVKGIEEIEQLPVGMYDRIKSGIMKKREENTSTALVLGTL